MSNKKFIARVTFWFSVAALVISSYAWYQMSINEAKIEILTHQNQFNSDLLTVVSKRSVAKHE